MQDEEIDIIIRDSASKHHPAYDDKAWGMMGHLLDKHLPLKKERRRWILFLLLFLILDASIFLVIVNPWKNKDAIAAENHIKYTPSSTINKDSSQTGNINGNIPKQIKQNKALLLSTDSKIQTVIGNPCSIATVEGNEFLNTQAKRKTHLNNKARLVTRIKSPGTVNNNTNDLSYQKEKRKIVKDEEMFSSVFNNNNATELINKKAITPAVPLQENSTTLITNTDSSKIKKPLLVEPVKDVQLVLSTKDKKKKPKNFQNNFGIWASGGADLSYISFNNPGKLTFIYGAGVSYMFAKHIFVRTGFYFSEKIYSATPDQYNGTIYPNLDKIDGECKVYEIPLSISYNFGQRKKHSWFGGIGISSYLMKKEYYNYEYKTLTGQYYYYTRTLNDKNKHYFSVLTFSGGYQYKVNNRFSLIAEPYLKLPLNGIGYGKMKLNSAGILLTLTVKPFAKGK